MAQPDHGSAEAPRDFSAELEASEARLAEAERYLGLDRLQQRRVELEAEAAKPDLWNDGDRARAITTELGQVVADLEQLTGLRDEVSEARALLELVDESRAEGSPDASFETELVQSVDALHARLAALEMQSLFSGEYDGKDAVAEVHAGAGGTDAQDWTEMMLRMYQRWAERRGFTVELDEATEGQEAGLLSATFIVRGRFAYGRHAISRRCLGRSGD
jgi:peptide chain release factor 2